MIGGRHVPLWLVILATALLAALFTLGLDRGIAMFRRQPTATPGATHPVIVTIETPEPALEPSATSDDETQQALVQLQQQMTQYRGYIFIQKAERQVTSALEALSVNNTSRADSELIAARAALDEAFRLVPENLKPPIDSERLEMGRVRANLEINPNGLDEELRRMRDRLQSLIVPQSP